MCLKTTAGVIWSSSRHSTSWSIPKHRHQSPRMRAKHRHVGRWLGAVAISVALVLVPALVHADPLQEALSKAATEDFSPMLRAFLLLSMLSVIPLLLISLTSFTRIIVVLSLLRSALGLQQTPP